MKEFPNKHGDFCRASGLAADPNNSLLGLPLRIGISFFFLAGLLSKPATTDAHALPEEIVARAKTGFGVPTGAWAWDMSVVGGSKGLTSRGWSRFVVRSAGTACDKWLAVSR